MHGNAEITNAQATTRTLLTTVLSIQTGSSESGGKSREQIIEEIVVFLESKIPKPFNLKEVSSKYPTKYTESMNTVLVQEIQKYNRLIGIISTSLSDLKRGLQGLIAMNDELDSIATSLYQQAVPGEWGDIFLSLKPLMSWVEDFQKRIKFMQDWVNKGKPNVFWFSGFCFPQAFITGTLQNFARSKKIAIDRITFSFKYIDTKNVEDITEPPADGVYVYGMFMEGAKWNYNKHIIGHPIAKELYSELPLIWLVPEIDRKAPKVGIYKCPVYKVVSRWGTLSTTGHSTNFVMYIELPTEEHEDDWIRAGAAGFLALRS